jgi:hypothetical protein
MVKWSGFAERSGFVEQGPEKFKHIYFNCAGYYSPD